MKKLTTHNLSAPFGARPRQSSSGGQLTTSLSVNIAGIKMKNPVMCASGTFNFGEEYSKFFDLRKLGALITKTITLNPRQGNPPPRIYETPSGMLNSIGLQNPGVETFLKEKMPSLRKIGIPIIVSIAGENAEEYIKVAKELKREKGISAIELNISCPNVRSGRDCSTVGQGFSLAICRPSTKADLRKGLPYISPNKIGTTTMFSQDAISTFEVVHKVRKVTNFPLIVKLTPNVMDITIIARAAQKGGADAISLINTPLGMAVNLEKRAPVLSAVTGGLSGPAIKPIALRMVWEVYNAVKIPIIGMGGIMTARDALEFIIVGASAVAVGTANFVNPLVIPEIIEGMKDYLIKNKIKNINSLVGTLKV